MTSLDCTQKWVTAFVNYPTDGTKVNVREKTSTTDSAIIVQISYGDLVQYQINIVEEKWIPVRVYRLTSKNNVSDYAGYVHSDFIRFVDIATLCTSYPPESSEGNQNNNSDTPIPVLSDLRFVDLPIEGWPTMLLTHTERQTLGKLLNLLSSYILNAATDFNVDNINLASTEALLFAVVSLEETLKQIIATTGNQNIDNQIRGGTQDIE